MRSAVFGVLLAVLLVFGAGGCGKVKSESNPASPGVAVSGNVVDSSGRAVSGARVELYSDPVIVTSTADGSWTASLPPGDHTIIVILNSKTIFKATFTLGSDGSISNMTTEIGRSLSGGSGGLLVTPDATAVAEALAASGGSGSGGSGGGGGGGSSDTQYPSAPSNVTATAYCSPRRVVLSWGAATDNVGVVGYRIGRDSEGGWFTTTTGTSITDTAPRIGANESYAVQAYDAANNPGVNGGSNGVNTAACAS